MKRLIPVLLSLVLVLALVPATDARKKKDRKPGADSAPAETAAKDVPVTATLQLDQAVYEVGQVIRGEATLVNRSAAWHEIPDASTLPRSLRLVGEDGKEIAPAGAEKFGAARTTSLGPGGFVGFAFDAALLFPGLSQPGRYTLAFRPEGIPPVEASFRVIPAFDPAARYELHLATPAGPVTIELFTGDAPEAVHNVVSLARAGGYADPRQVRIRKGMLALVGHGGPRFRFRGEETPIQLLAGTVIVQPAGRTFREGNTPNLGILLEPRPDWQGKVTAIGQVTEGLEALLTLAKTPVRRDGSGRPISPLDLKVTVVEKKASGEGAGGDD